MPITDEQDEKLTFMLETLVGNRASLNGWEQGFLDDNVKRHDEHGVNVHLSPKQWSVLDKMYAKVTEV